jgi:hypothetical protein
VTVLCKRSRWKRCPTGKPVILSRRDVEIFKLLNRYRYLRTSTIAAFLAKKDKTHVSRRLADLYHEQPYLSRYDTRRKLANADHQDDVYELTALSRQVLGLNGTLARTTDTQVGNNGEYRYFQHALMICDILSSIELGCMQGGIRYIGWEEIVAKAMVKEYKVMAHWEGKEYPVVPDGLFGLEYPDKSFRFFALEADRGTEPLVRTNLLQTSYKKKLLLYRSILLNQTYKKHWGVPNLYVATVTTSEQRMEHMKEVLLSITGGRGNTVFLFKTYKGTPFSAPPADGHMLSESWLRAGYPPLYIGPDKPLFEL